MLIGPRQDRGWGVGRGEAPLGGVQSSGSLPEGGTVLSEEKLGWPQKRPVEVVCGQVTSILRGGRSGGWVSEEGKVGWYSWVGGLLGGARTLWWVCSFSRPAAWFPLLREQC